MLLKMSQSLRWVIGGADTYGWFKVSTDVLISAYMMAHIKMFGLETAAVLYQL